MDSKVACLRRTYFALNMLENPAKEKLDITGFSFAELSNDFLIEKISSFKFGFIIVHLNCKLIDTKATIKSKFQVH